MAATNDRSFGARERARHESAITASIKGWLGRSYPEMQSQTILIEIVNWPSGDARAEYLLRGNPTRHYLRFNERFVDSPLFPAIAAHEVGHLVNHARGKQRMLRLLWKVRRKTPDDGFDDFDFWALFLSGAYVFEEVKADWRALRILTTEGLSPGLLLENIRLPREDRHPIHVEVVDWVIRWARIVNFLIWSVLRRSMRLVGQ